MKALQTKAIIYDDHCPMCAFYTKGFVKMGVLDACNRIPFSKLEEKNLLHKLDFDRARHEIPLVDLFSGETIYGLDSMIYVLKQKFPIIGRIMKIKPLYWFFKKLYKLVSYNRRIIIPAEKRQNEIDITPDFNLKYRLLFVAFAVLFSVLITYLFGEITSNYLPITQQANSGLRMLAIAGTGWFIQIAVAGFFMDAEKRIDYIGHLSVLMMAGVLILIPSLIISPLTNYTFSFIPIISVLCSSAFMLWQHYKRVKLLQLSQLWTISWFLSLQITAAFWVYIFYFKNL